MKKKYGFGLAAGLVLTVLTAFLAVRTAASGLPVPALTSLTSGGSGQMTIAWNAVSGAKGYNVYRASGSDTYKITVHDENGNVSFNGSAGYTKIASVGADVISYTDTGLVDGRTYEYTVEAYDDGGASGYGTGLSGHTAYDVLQCWEMRISNLTSSGFDVTAKVVSQTGISKVNVAVWSRANGQDDLKWTQASGGNGVYTCRVNTSDHNGETGMYEVHVEPMDNNGKKSADYGEASNNFAYIMVPSKAPTLTNPAVNGVSASGYQVALTFYSESGVKSAEAVTWTTAGGEDDVKTTGAQVDAANHIIRADIKASDHKNETGEYNTKIRMYNNDGKITTYDFKVNVGNAGSELAVTHIDVCFGDATLIESAGKYMLVDCAESDEVYNVLQILKEKNTGKIPVLISHVHSDHAGGLIPLIEAGFVSAVYVDTAAYSEVYFDGRKVEENLNYARSHGVPVTDINAQKSYQVGNATVEVVGPVKSYGYAMPSSTNNRSIWLRVTGGGKKYLLAGDSEMIAERDLVAAGVNIDVDYVKLNHHGLRSSTSAEYIKATSPAQAFVSDNPFNAPVDASGTKRMTAAGVPVFHTQQVGTILNRITDGKNIVTAMKCGEEAPAPSYVYGGVDYTNEFDPVYYSNRYPDLKAAFGNNEFLLLQHWVQFGKREQRTAKDPNAPAKNSGNSGSSGGKYVYGGVDYTNEFDPVYYSNRYPDLKAAFGNNGLLLLQHWVQFGKREQRTAKDPNAPARNSGNSGSSGGKYVYGGVDYTNEFDPVYYSNSYPDLKAAFGNNEYLLLQHWVQFGKRERRTAKGGTPAAGGTYVYNGVDYSGEFNPDIYASRYADLRAAFGNNSYLLLQHWVQFGKRENRRAL